VSEDWSGLVIDQSFELDWRGVCMISSTGLSGTTCADVGDVHQYTLYEPE